MNIIPKVECRRCGREFSGLRSRCPYCGTTRVRAGDTVPPITASEVPGTPAAQRAEVNTRWQTIFGLLLLACVVLAVVVLITISLADAKEINSSTAQNLPTQDILPEEWKFADQKASRTIIGRLDRNNYLILTVTKSKGKGVSLRRAQKFFLENFNAEWVYNLDGGQSYALMSRKQGKKKINTLAGGSVRVVDVMGFTE